jgi:hypothetical protein
MTVCFTHSSLAHLQQVALPLPIVQPLVLPLLLLWASASQTRLQLLQPLLR